MASLRIKNNREGTRQSSSPQYDQGGQQQQQQPLRQDPLARVVSPPRTMDLRERGNVEAKQMLMVANVEVAELQHSLQYAEYKLAQTIAEKETLEHAKRQQTYQVEDLTTKLKQRDQGSLQMDQMYQQLESQLSQKDQQQEHILDQTRSKLNELQREITFRENEVKTLSHKIKYREMECDGALVSQTLGKLQINKLQQGNDDKDQLIADLKQKLFETQQQLDQTVLTRKSEGTALLQAEHYKLDNEKLVKLLANTKEFKNFGEFAADSGTSVRFLDPSIGKAASSAQQNSGSKTQKSESEEMEDWIPEDAFKVAHEFRNKCASQVSKALMNTFLKDLNKVWRTREAKQITRIKAECNREVQFLRRQVQFKKPYEKVMHQTDVKRLRGELKTAKAALRENVAVIKQDERGPNKDGLLVIDQTVKYTNEIQMERRKLREEKELLQAELDKLKLKSSDQGDDREKFYEGAAWLGRQTLTAAEEGVKKSENLKTEYLSKVAEHPNDEFMRGRAAEWLVDSSIRLTQQTKDQNQRLLEKALRNNA